MSILKTLFGKCGGPSVSQPTNDVAADRTLKATAAEQTTPRVQAIRASAISADRDGKVQGGDTGPWYVGKTVGEIFEIRGVLGRGGMGIVYRAYDTATMRDVAVKLPLGKFVDDEDAKKLFTREAEAWTGLVHPHIVHAFDVKDNQTTDYRPAIFMDYCDGGSLADRLRTGPLPLTDALDFAIQVCWAMEFAHQKGHIHRDLKPANVLLMSDGRALVSDFGLVKILGDEELAERYGKGAKAAGLGTSLRETGGTPAYMPPEQWAGRATKQSDIYAFGVMLYELFCGVLPFTADDPAGQRAAHEEVPAPDPKRMNGRIPDVLSGLMLACLAKQPAGRSKDFGVVAAGLVQAYQAAAVADYSSQRSKPGALDIPRADQEARAWSLIRMGIGCYRRGDLEDADRQFRKARVFFDSLGDQAGIGACFTDMGVVARSRGDYQEAMTLYKRALGLFESLNHPNSMSSCYICMGNLAFERGDYDEAMELFGKSLTINDALNDRDVVATCHNSMGAVAAERGDYDQALELFGKSLAIRESLDDRSGMGGCYNNMGSLARSLKNYDEALELHAKALAVYEELGDRAGMAGCYGNMGTVAGEREDYDEAMQMYRKAVALFQVLGDEPHMAHCYGNMGIVANARWELEESMEQHKKALAIYKALGNKAGMGTCYFNMTFVAQRLTNRREARAFARKAIKLRKTVGAEVEHWLYEAAGLSKQPLPSARGKHPPRRNRFPDVSYMKTQRQGHSEYNVYVAPSRERALAFLREKEVKDRATFVIVETPEGSFGRDLTVIFAEKTGEILELGKRKSLSRPQKSTTHCSICGHFVFPASIKPDVQYSINIEDFKEKGYGFRCRSCQAVLCAHHATLAGEDRMPHCVVCGETTEIHGRG